MFLERKHEESSRRIMYIAHFVEWCMIRQWVMWGKTEILKGFVYESKAFGSYFTNIKEPAQGQNLLNCRRV